MNLKNLKTKWFFFKYSLVKPNARAAFREALHNQYLPQEELENLSWSRTCSLLRYAYEHVPYYRDKFKHLGLHPSDITRSEHYRQVPILTRDDIRRNFDKLISLEARPKDLKLSTTGGSTGEPLKVYHEKKVVRSAMLWRVLDWWNLSPDVNVASIYRDLTPNWKSRLCDAVFWWPTKKVLLDVSHMNEDSINRFLLKYQQYKPLLVHAYVGALDHVSEYVLENGIELSPPNTIWSTCSPLTPTQERRIQKAFRAPVFDHYGCSEVYWLAAECPQKKGLHIFHDVVRVEFLDNNNIPVPHGELGCVAITDLLNRYFPLIRYLNGDMGRSLQKECSCGITLPLMDKVKGRISDTIRLPNGSIVAGEYLTTIFDDEPEVIHRFQVIQRKDYSIDILVVPNNAYPAYEQVLEQVQAKLSLQLKNAVSIRTTCVGSLPSQQGKLHFIRSELDT